MLEMFDSLKGGNIASMTFRCSSLPAVTSVVSTDYKQEFILLLGSAVQGLSTHERLSAK